MRTQPNPYGELCDLDYYVPESWVLLGSIDESAPYEIDLTAIYRTPTGFALVTASGCSCWSGEYESEEYKTLDEMEAALPTIDRQWNPSFRGTPELIAIARTRAAE